MPDYPATNTSGQAFDWTWTADGSHWTVDDTLALAFEHYGDLLRRLGDA